MKRIEGPGKCMVEGCERMTHALGLCKAHYLRQNKHGESALSTPIKNLSHIGKPCQVAGCDNLNYGNGLCRKHWERFDKYGADVVKIRGNGEGTINVRFKKKAKAFSTDW